MVGVYLSVWVRRGILQHVRGVQVTYVGTGMMGYLGNKGAAAEALHMCTTSQASSPSRKVYTQYRHYGVATGSQANTCQVLR